MTHSETVARSGSPSSEEATPNQRILHSIRRITHVADVYSRRLVLEFGITAPQLMVLSEIATKGAMTARSLAGEIHLSASTLVGVIDRLESKGLAQRQRTPADRRKVLIAPTEEGKSLVERAPSALPTTLADALMHLTHEEQVTIARSLEKIVDLMELGTWTPETLGGALPQAGEAAGGFLPSEPSRGV